MSPDRAAAPLTATRLPIIGRLPTTRVSGAEVALRNDIAIPADADGLEHLLRTYAGHPIADGYFHWSYADNVE